MRTILFRTHALAKFSSSQFLTFYFHDKQHYDQLAKRAVKSGHVVDIHACSLDQVGLLEMRHLVKRTGGVSILADDFDGEMFKKSFHKIFARDETENIAMAFNATLEVQVLTFHSHIPPSLLTVHCFLTLLSDFSRAESLWSNWAPRIIV